MTDKVMWSNNTAGQPIMNARTVVLVVGFPLELHPSMVDVLAKLRAHFSVVVCSHVMESYRTKMMDALKFHNVYIDGLYMRPQKDERPPAQLQEDLLKEVVAVGFAPELMIYDTYFDDVHRPYLKAGVLCFGCGQF